MQPVLPLSHLSIGKSALIERVQGKGAMYERLYDLGFTPGTVATCLFQSVFGDPRAYRIKGTIIAIRQSDAENIKCSFLEGEV